MRGAFVERALWTTLPPLLILLLWALLEPRVIDLILTAQLPDSIRAGGEAEIRLALSKVYNLANDSDLMGQQGLLGPVAEHLQALQARVTLLRGGVIMSLLLLGGARWRPS